LSVLAGWSLLPASLVGLLFSPGLTLAVLPWLAVALAAIVYLVLCFFPNPAGLSRLPVWLTCITLLRLLADVVATGALLWQGGQGEVRVEQAWAWLAIFLVVLLQLTLVTIGASQSEAFTRLFERFVLDAMPGKQMAIDADAHSGLLDEHEVRLARRELERTCEFIEFLCLSARFSHLDRVISGLLLLATGWEAWLVFAHGQQSALDKILVHNLLSALAALWLHEALFTTRRKLVDLENLGSELLDTRDRSHRIPLVWPLVLGVLLLQGQLGLMLGVWLILIVADRWERGHDNPEPTSFAPAALIGVATLAARLRGLPGSAPGIHDGHAC
jgi:hypothetical protein